MEKDQLLLRRWPNKGPSIYDVYKKITFLTPPPVHMRPHGPDTPPPVDFHTRSTWNTHRSLEMASTMTYTGPKAEIRLYDSNLFKLYF